MTDQDFDRWRRNATDIEQHERRGAVFVALDDRSRVCGAVSISYERTAWMDIHGADFAIHGMYVETKSAGLGAALLESVLRDAERRQAHRGLLAVADYNDAAQRFYRRHGFTAVTCHRFYSSMRFVAMTITCTSAIDKLG